MTRGARLRSVLFLVITLFALWVRVPVLRQGLWEDEATAVYAAKSPTIHEFLRRQAATDYSPPLFNATVAAFGRAVGFGEVRLKALAIGLGALACGAIALAGAEAFGLAGGLIAGLCAVTHPLLIEMSGEVRPYSLSALLSALFFWSVFRLRRRWGAGKARTADFVVTSIATTLAVNSHYAATVAAAAAGGVALLFVIAGFERGFWSRVVAAMGIGGATFLPWLPIALRQKMVGLPWSAILRPELKHNLTVFRRILLLPRATSDVSFAAVAGIAVLAAAALASLPAVRRETVQVAPAAAMLIAAVTASFFLVGQEGTVMRYMTVPSALAMLFWGGVGSIAVRAGWSAGPPERAVAGLGLSLLTFAAVRNGIDDRQKAAIEAHSGRSKSGLRDLCRTGVIRSGDLVVAAPDYLAPSLLYYSRPGIVLRGFVHWDEPAFTDFSDYRARWNDPRAVEQAMASIDAELRRGAEPRIAFVAGLGAVNNPLPFGERTSQLAEALRKKYPVADEREFSGRVEGARLIVFQARP